MDDLIEFLFKIQKKPALYFGNRRTLTDLSNFISGFVTGREGTNKEIKKIKTGLILEMIIFKLL